MVSELKPVSPRRPVRRPEIDSVTTINADGSRPFLYPADVTGRFTTARRFAAYGLIAVYLLLPWIPVRGHPAVFLDITERRFHCFGLVFAAQEVWLLFFAVSGLGFTLFFVTALFGRLWCGWACPQTVFLDHVFRRIERWIDGDAPARRALAAAPLTPGKAGRRVAKHALYALAALLITHLFLAYFVSIPRLWTYMHAAPGEHWAAFVFVFLAGGVLYFNFAWFREQLCIVICPYGRLQSALTDDHSLVIGYDEKRGEPRGRIQAGVATARGDCVDCARCVQVCPTGIDIRHGLQLECIGCSACIDACDAVMTRLHRPAGLIRYDSLAGLDGNSTRWIRPRILLYAGLLITGAAVAGVAFSRVKPFNLSVQRMTSAAYFVTPAEVRNQFMVRIVNKQSEPATFTLQLAALPAGSRHTGFEEPVTLAPLGEILSPLVVLVDRKEYRGPFKFTVRVADAAGAAQFAREAEFMGPDARLLEEEDHDQGITR